MACEENGHGIVSAVGRRGVRRKRRAGGSRDVQLVVAAALPGATFHRTPQFPMQPDATLTSAIPADYSSFFPSPIINVSPMEEITFWVCTRRAPCLYRYNNVFKKQNEDAHCSKYRHDSEPSVVDKVPSPRKKKKLRILEDDESASIERQNNVYFETSQKQYHASWYSSSKSVTDRSDVDFNVKNYSIQNKSKTSKLRRKNCSGLKKNKVITSTPKPTTLRRSLRKSQQNLNYSSNLNCSYGLLNSRAINGEHRTLLQESAVEHKNHTSGTRKSSVLKEQTKNEIVLNGQFEDISDVSGFTANYIRSTKINSKTPRKARNKSSRNLVRESQGKLQKDESKIIVCVNKSANIGQPAPALNHSTDSSQNIINVITINNNNNESQKVNQSTSQLEMSGYKNDQVKDGEKNITQLNISFQSKSSGTSRYPIRHRNNSKPVQDTENNRSSLAINKKVCRGSRELKRINTVEQIDVSWVSRTRSGKKIGVIQTDLEESKCSQDQTNNLLTDRVSSNVKKSVGKKKRVTHVKKQEDREPDSKDSGSDSAEIIVGEANSSSPVKCASRRAVDKTRKSLNKDSLGDKSGFAACFSDSEEEKPLKRRKFFC